MLSALALTGLVVGLVALPPPAVAAPSSSVSGTATVSGTVTDAETGEPLAGALVSDPDLTAEPAVTDAEGSYTLELDPGSHRVQAAADDHASRIYLDTTGSEPTDQLVLESGESRTGVDLALHGTARISGLVQSDADGSPVAGVVVNAYDADADAEAAPEATTQTDSTGGFALTGLEEAQYVLEFDASETSFMSQWWQGVAVRQHATALPLTWGQELSGLVAELPRAATISGRVTDEDGAPIPDVDVTANEDLRGGLGWARTDADGRFTVRGLPAGQYTLRFNARDHLDWSYGMGSSDDSARYFSVPEGATIVDKDIALRLGARISGVVTTSDDDPYAYPDVQVSGADGYEWGYVESDGTYVVRGLDAGPHTVSFEAYGYDTQWWDHVSTEDEATEVDLVLGQELPGIDGHLVRHGEDPDPVHDAVLTGVLADSATGPVQGVGASVRCEDDETGESTYDYAQSDASGRYALGVDSGSTCELNFEDEAQQIAATTWHDEDGEDQIEVVSAGTLDLGTTYLARGARLSGQVLGGGPADGQGVYDVRVDAIPAGGGAVTSTYTDESGDYVFRALPADFYTLRFRPSASTGYQETWWQQADRASRATYVRAHAGESIDHLDARLARVASISGEVHDAEGAPVADVYVTAVLAGKEYGNGVYTDEDGGYTLGGLTPGSYTVGFDGAQVGYTEQWWQNAKVESQATPVSLGAGDARTDVSAVLTRAPSISGQVTGPDGQPVADVWVQATLVGDRYLGDSTQTDAEGRFEAVGLAPGDYVVNYQPAHGSDLAPEWWVDAPSRAEATLLTLADGDHGVADAVLDLGVAISGTVTTQPDTQDPWPWVHIESTTDPDLSVDLWTGDDEDGGGGVDAAGHFSATGLPAGSYRVQAGAQEHATRWWEDAATAADATPVTVAAGETRDAVDFALTHGGTIAGHVTDADGGPVADAYVRAIDLTTHEATSASSGVDGGYRIQGLTDADYLVLADGDWPFGKRWYGDAETFYDAVPVATSEADPAEGIDVVLPRFVEEPDPDPLPLTGRVTLPEGLPDEAAADLEVELLDANLDYVDETSTEADGTFSLNAYDGPASYFVRVSEPGWRPRTYGLRPTTLGVTLPAQAPVEIAMTVGGTIRGAVVNEVGTPLHASVEAIDSSGHVYEATVRHGRYRLTGLAAGPVQLRVQAPAPYISAWVTGDGEDPQPLTFDVVEGETQVAPDAVVRLGGAVSGRVTPPPGSYYDDLFVEAVDAEGAVLARTSARDYGPQDYLLQGLPAGEFTLRFSGSDAVTQYWQHASDLASATMLQVDPGETLEGLDVTLESPDAPPPVEGTASVSGTITARGEPVGDVTVSLQRGDDGYYEELTTGADGAYAFADVPAGEFLLTASSRIGTEWNTYQYVERYWPGTSDRDELEWITVPDGDALTGMDLDMVTTGFDVAPVPVVAGQAVVGQTLTASVGEWSPQPSSYEFQWFADGQPIAGADTDHYLLTAGDQGAVITVRVRAILAGRAPISRTSDGTEPVTGPGVITGATPTLAGRAREGDLVAATVGSWQPAPVTLTYAWLRSGSAIAAAAGTTYTLTSEDVGKTITFRVTGSRPGYADVVKESAGLGPVEAALGTLTSPVPVVSGEAKVGSTLTSLPGTWLPAPVTLSYQWLRGGAAIPGATGPTYSVVADDLTHALSVRVTGAKAGYESAVRVSAPTAAVGPGALVTATPVVTGAAAVGKTLSATPGAWGPAPVDLTYQWRRAGALIPGATGPTYVLAAGDLGKRLSVDVSGSRTGYVDATVSSAPTGVVVAGTLTGTKPAITGKAKVGQRLKVVTGRWGPAPVRLAIQWYRNGTAIAGARSATYVVKAADLRKRITVRVLGTKAGYTSLGLMSAKTRAVTR